MKAIVYTRYGPPDVLQLQERERPSPKGDEVLVRVRAASLNAIDWRQFAAPLLLARLLRGGLREPRHTSVGADVAGRVEAVGASVTRLQPGDEVFGLCRGACAEYVAAAEDRFVLKPAAITFEAAAAVPLAALTALQALRDHGDVRFGQRVVIHGAGGGVGTYAVQIARAFGAEITAVCSTRNVVVVRAIGADHVVDYTKEDFTKRGPYDLIVVVNGSRPILQYWRALTATGRCVIVGGSIPRFFQGMLLRPLLSRLGRRELRLMMTQPQQKDLAFLKELLESGKVVPVIDRRYPLRDVAEAMRYLLRGHSSGKVIITVEEARADEGGAEPVMPLRDSISGAPLAARGPAGT
jgi:NADPH:quinone reductase-like Zn-dependent oxidoreductase